MAGSVFKLKPKPHLFKETELKPKPTFLPPSADRGGEPPPTQPYHNLLNYQVNHPQHIQNSLVLLSKPQILSWHHSTGSEFTNELTSNDIIPSGTQVCMPMICIFSIPY